VVDDASVADARCILAGCAVLDGFDEHLDGVLARAEIDYLKSLLHDVSAFGFLAAVLAGSHEPVDDAFDDVDVGFAEALVFVASHTVRRRHRSEVEVAL